MGEIFVIGSSYRYPETCLSRQAVREPFLLANWGWARIKVTI